MTDVTGLTKALRAKAAELGFSMVGIIPARPARRLNAYRAWLAAEMHGTMGYLARPDRIARRQDLNVILPGVKSLVCVGLDYFTLRLPDHIAHDPGRGRISNYAWGVDYHEVMTPRLHELAAWLQTEADTTSAETSKTAVATTVYVDTGAILERDHAESAGLGFTGKNTMLIGPRRGSFFFLGELLTTLPLAYDEMKPSLPTCGRCRRCLDDCPTNAFPQPYVLDARRCISYLTIELKGWIPPELRPLLGNWIYGCDVCQDVCPFNRFAQPTTAAGFAPTSFDVAAPPLLDLLRLNETAFNSRFAHSPIKRIKRRGLLRNVCVAAGNWGSQTAVVPLARLLHDPEPLIRGHAAWALHQIGGPQARTALAQARQTETDRAVRSEIEGPVW